LPVRLAGLFSPFLKQKDIRSHEWFEALHLAKTRSHGTRNGRYHLALFLASMRSSILREKRLSVAGPRPKSGASSIAASKVLLIWRKPWPGPRNLPVFSSRLPQSATMAIAVMKYSAKIARRELDFFRTCAASGKLPPMRRRKPEFARRNCEL